MQINSPSHNPYTNPPIHTPVQDREPGPPSNYLNEFFNFDPVANKTEDKLFGCTAILTNEEFWDAIQEGLYPLLESNWSVILFEMESRYGKKVGDNARRKALDTDQAIKFLESYGLMAGWGKFHT